MPDLRANCDFMRRIGLRAGARPHAALQVRVGRRTAEQPDQSGTIAKRAASSRAEGAKSLERRGQGSAVRRSTVGEGRGFALPSGRRVVVGAPLDLLRGRWKPLQRDGALRRVKKVLQPRQPGQLDRWQHGFGRPPNRWSTRWLIRRMSSSARAAACLVLSSRCSASAECVVRCQMGPRSLKNALSLSAGVAVRGQQSPEKKRPKKKRPRKKGS